MPITSLSSEHIRLVKETYPLLLAQGQDVAERFYNKLFELAPDTHPLFHGDIHAQGTKFMQMFSVIIGGLDMITELKPVLEMLGQGHTRYGVRKEHYDLLGQALLYSLEVSLGSTFTPEVREAWTTLFKEMADTAISKAYGE